GEPSRHHCIGVVHQRNFVCTIMKFWSSFFIVLFAISKASLSQITITFIVDMSGQSITPQGVHIAGQFALVNAISITQNWQPGAPGSQLTLVSSSTYSIQVVFPSSSAGKKLEFQFVRSNIWLGSEDYSEGNPGDPNAYLDNSCGVADGGGGFNRIITIPACGGQFTTLWNYCGTLSATSPPSLSVSSHSQICPGQSIQLSATSNGNVEWSPSTGLSCSLCNMGTNTVFTSPVVFRIYNRWGELIFETKDVNDKWEGKLRALTQGSGSYVYYLWLYCNGKTIVMKGVVTLIR